MAYLANFTVIKMGSVRPAFAYTLIATSLLVGMYGSGVNASGIFPMGSAKIVAVVLLTLPLLFSGLAFRVNSTLVALVLARLLAPTFWEPWLVAFLNTTPCILATAVFMDWRWCCLLWPISRPGVPASSPACCAVISLLVWRRRFALQPMHVGGRQGESLGIEEPCTKA